jgi:hypothetical protein
MKIHKNLKNSNKMVEEIVENADILLEVLDARDPMGC